jgi:hypothetical protein
MLASGDTVSLGEDPVRGCTVCDRLKEVTIFGPSQAAAVLSGLSSLRSKRHRTAHTIVQIRVDIVDSDGLRKVNHRRGFARSVAVVNVGVASICPQTGRLAMIDMGGFDKSPYPRESTVDARLRKSVNQSVLAFGRVIQALARNDPRVPYRFVAFWHTKQPVANLMPMVQGLQVDALSV